MAGGVATIKLRGDVRDAHAGMTKIEADTKRLMLGVDGLDNKMGLLTSNMPGVSKAFNVMTKAGVVGLAIAAVGELGSRIADLSKESLEVQAAFNNLQFGIAGAAEASRGLVDDFTLAQSQVKALELGAISSKEEFEQLIEAGTILGITMQGDAAKGVEDLTTALARQSGPIADNLGLQITRTSALKELIAQAEKEGRVLSEQEKQRAFQTILLQKATKAAKEKNLEDGIALETQRALVAVENLRLKGLGAEVPVQAALNEAIAQMGDEILALDVENHGEDLKKVTKILREMNVEIEGNISATQVQNTINREANRIYAEREELERKRKEEKRQEGLRIFRKETAEMQHQLEVSRALGISESELLEDKRAIWDRQVAIVEKEIEGAKNAEERVKLEEDLLKVKRGIELMEIKGIEAETKRRGGGRRGKSRLEKEKEALAARRREMERTVEVMEAMGVATYAARQALLDFDAVNALDEDKAEAIHQQRIGRLEEERRIREAGDEARKAAREQWYEWEEEDRKAEEDRIKRMEDAAKRNEKILAKREKEQAKRDAERARRIDSITQRSMDATTEMTSVLVSASKARGEAGRQEVGEYAAGQAKIMTIAAAKHTALGIAASVTGRPLKATAEFTAAGIAGAQAGAFGILAGAMGFGGSSGEDGFSGGSRYGASGTGVSGPPPRPESGGTAPVSPLEQNGAPVPQGSSTPGGQTINVNVQGHVVDGGKLQEMINDAATGEGSSFKGGMN